MNSKNLTFILLITISSKLFAQTMVNIGQLKQTGGFVVLTGSTSWKNNGTVTLNAGTTVKFTGTGNQDIDGSNTTAFANLTIDKSGNTNVIVKRNISVLGTLTMVNGYLDLKDYEVDLSTSGSVTGENENARIKATNASGTEGLGTGRLKATRTNPTGNVAGLGLDFTPSTNMGNTVIYRGHLQQSGSAISGNSIWRYYEIQPTTYATLTVNNFYFFDAELNGNTPISDLKMMQLYNTSGNWQIRPTTPTDVASPDPNTASSSTAPNSLSYIKVTLAKSSCTLTATASSNSPQCEGATLNLNVSTSGGVGTLSYSWSGPNGFTSTQQNPSIPNVTTVNAGTYYVTVTDALNCTATSQVSVTINSNPLASANATPNPICAGATLNLSASAGNSWNWSGPAGFSSSSQNPTISNISTTQAGTYSVTVTQANGCTRTASVNVTVNPNPTASANANPNPVCEGATLNLSASAGNTWNWSGPAGFSSSSQNPTISNISSTQAGTYSVT
ncbi:MAG: hypothetical protein N3A01_05785, partial [Bacteroidales bacterium]|nr:hypothetical protein [Bacteroidales bacterium]